MVATCYTLRPGPESGWVTFFELGRGVAFQGFFLILGPATPAGSRADAEARQEAQTVARAIVTAWKNRAGTELTDWLGGLSRLVALAARPIEYGAVILKGEEIHFLCQGHVRVFPLTTSARHRWEADLPGAGQLERRRVAVGDRFFFGRLPDEHLRGLPTTDALEGVERAAGQDGALILTFLPGGAPSEPAGPARPARVLPFPVNLEVMAPTPAPITTARRLTPATPLVEPPIGEAPATPIDPVADKRPRPHLWPWFAAGAGILALMVYFLVLRPRPQPSVPDGRATAVPSMAPAESSGRGVTGTIGSLVLSTSGGSAGIAWETTLDGAITGTPLVLSDRVIVASRDGTIAALSRNEGRILWSHKAQKGFGGGAIGNDTLTAVAGFDGIVRLMSPADGREVARLATDSRIASPPARTSEGLIVAGAYDRTLHALDPGTGRPAWKARLGGILWATPGVGRKYLYAPGLDGVMTAVNSKWGSVLWRFRAGGEIYSSPAVTDVEVVFGCEDGSIYALSAGEGTLLWRAPVGPAVSGGVRIHENMILVGDDGGILHALERASGREIWRYAAGGSIKSTPLVDSGCVLISAHDGALHALDLPTGNRIGRYPIGSPIAAAPAMSGDTLFVGTHDGRVVALRLR
ncbi:MAG: PQQ-binding-like beta-propeller repeat protein [Candidatus Eisenbacteria bacterium]|nr:PQQ-binding-like beta-propeller repeat protein [Candidatus Eisenbacteria bacterium]